MLELTEKHYKQGRAIVGRVDVRVQLNPYFEISACQTPHRLARTGGVYCSSWVVHEERTHSEFFGTARKRAVPQNSEWVRKNVLTCLLRLYCPSMWPSDLHPFTTPSFLVRYNARGGA